MQRQDRPIGLGRAVEGDALAHPLEHARNRRVVGAGGEKAAARDLVILALAPALCEPLGEARHDRVLDVFAGAEAVQFDAVAFLGRHFEHRRTHRGDHHRGRRRVDRLGREVRGHQRETIVLALVARPFAGLPAMPDRAQDLHVFAHARRRRGPRHREAPLIVRPDLRA